MSAVHRVRHRSLLSLLGVLVVGLAIGCADPGEQLEQHLTAGEGYLEAEQWAEAGIEFRNMLQIDPNSAAGHWGLARARLGAGDARGAYWELQETVRLDPENVEARLRYGQFLIFGKPEDVENAVQTADEVLARDPKSWQAWVLRARALGALRRTEEVGPALAKATEVAPEEPGPKLLYANYLRSEERHEEAEGLFREVTELQPGFPSFAALAGFLASLDRDEEAEGMFRKAISLAEPGERVPAYSMFANFYMARDRGEEAEQVLRKGIEEETDSVDLIYTLARFYHVQGRREQADAMILEATQADPSDPKPFLLLSNYRGQSGDAEGALEAAEQALVADPDFELAKLRKAEVLVDIGYREDDKARIAKGRSIVQAVLARDEAAPEALFVQAKINLAEREFDDAVASVRRALDGKPDWAQAHYLLASSLFLAGDRTQARVSANRALELDANLVDAQKLLARIHATLGDHQLAVETGRRVLEGSGGDVALRILVAQSEVRAGNAKAALAQLELIPEDERTAEAAYALGRVHTLLGNAEAAKTHLLAAHGMSPNQHEVLQRLLDIEVREGNIEPSIERIAAAVEAVPDSSPLRRLEGQVALYTGRTREAEEAFRKAIELDPNDLNAYGSLATFLAATGQSAEVVKTYERALAANPDSGALHMVVGTLYEMQKRADEAIEQYEEAIRLAPELAVAKNNLAYLLAEQGGNLDRALDLAQEAKAMLPDNPNAADTLGWVLLKKKVPSAAIDYLKEAVGGMQPGDNQISLVRHHLALAYEADSKLEQAREAWIQALGEIKAYRGEKDGEPERPAPPWAEEIEAGLERVGS